MKILFIIFALLITMGVSAQDVVPTEVTSEVVAEITPEVIPEVTPEVVTNAAPEDDYLSFFGISLEMFGILSAILFFLVEGIKRKLPTVFTGGENKWKTDVLLGVLAILLALKVFFPDPITIITCAVGLFIGGSGLHAFKKTIIN